MHKLIRLSYIFFKMELRNKAFLVPSFIFPLVMLTLMSVAGEKDGTHYGITYSSFLTPGILCMAYAAVALVAIPVMISSYREKGLLRIFKTSKLPISIIIFAIIISQIIFMLLQTILLLAFANFALQAQFHFNYNSWMAIPIILVGIFAILSLGFFISSFLPTSRSATMVGNLSNLIAIFLGGVFFPISVWPSFLQPIIWCNPLTWIIKALRQSLLYGTMNLYNLYTTVGILFIIGAISFFLSRKLFKYE